MKNTLALLFLCFCAFSCVTQKPEVELFYLGEGSLQYFFPSRRWVGLDSSLKVESDWLYRTYKLDGEEEERTVMNFTVYSEDTTISEVPAEMRFSMGNRSLEIPGDHLEIIYIDQNKTRFSCWFPSAALIQLLGGEEKTLEMEIGWSRIYHFETRKTWEPQFEYFRDVMLKNNKGL